MDRRIIYVDQNMLDVDQLEQSKHTMIGLGMTMRALLGTGTWFDGLACTPTGPASLDVLVGPGSAYSLQNVDDTAYGSIDADTTHQIIKQGINLGTLTLNCPAPGTTGQSINYLIQAAYEDVDTGPTVLPYFDADNPDQAFNGPNNTGTSQNTTREGQCVVNVKAGVAATTGSQTTPAPTAGFTGLYVVTVANGQSTITSGNISVAASAPFIAEKLNDKISQATGDARYLQTVNARTKLLASTTFYVNASTGSDSNNGLASGTPWLTLQHAANVLGSQYDIPVGINATVQAADYLSGTYAPFSVNGPFVGGGQVEFLGNTTTPSNVTISGTASNCIDVQNNAVLSIAGFKTETTSSGNCLNANEGGKIFIVGAMEYGSCAGSHRVAQGGGAQIYNQGNASTISGGAVNHLSAGIMGQVTDTGATTTLTGTPAFSGAFASSQNVSTIVANGNTYTGSATGLRFSTSNLGVINTAGGGPNYFPGNSTGVGTNPGASPYGLYL